MYRYIIFGLIFISHFKAAIAAQVSTCVIQKQFQNSNSVRDICSATLIDQTKILYDPSCTNGTNPRAYTTSNHVVTCGNGLLTFDISKFKSYRRGPSVEVFEINTPLPFLPTGHLKNEQQSLTKDCFIETHLKQIPVRSSFIKSDIERLEFTRDQSNAPVYCVDADSEETLMMGIVSNDGEFLSIEELNEKYGISSDFEVTLSSSDYEDDSISEICNSAYHCVNDLVEDAGQLNDQLEIILNQMKEVNSDPSLKQQRQKLAHDFQELENLCRRENIGRRINYNNIEDAGLGDKTISVIEKGFVGIARAIESINPFDNEDFLLSQFKNTAAIKENLSETEIERTFNKVNSLDLSNFEKIRELALAYSETIVDKVLTKMGTFKNEEQKGQFIAKYLEDFKGCLAKAINTTQVKACTNSFTNTISSSIGELELERQISSNFTPQDNIPSLQLKAKNSYLSCLDKNLGKFETVLDTTAVVKGCVYKGIIASYQQTRRNRLNDAIKGYTGTEDNNEIVSSILSKANTCRYAPIINSQEHTDQQYLALARLSTDVFTQEIGECIKSLQLNATGDVVEIAVRTNKQINESLSIDEINDLTRDLKDVHLKSCMEARNTTDGNECSKFITAMATLSAAESILRNEFEKQFTTLNLPQSRRDNLTTKIMDEYQDCAEQTREVFYEDLTKDPDEKLVNKCLTGAIKSLSSNILEDSINKATAEKGIDTSLVSRAIDRQKLKDLKEDIKRCFDEKLNGYETMSAYQSELQESIASCTFNTQKIVIESIAQVMADDKTSSFGLSGQKMQEVRRLISEHINKSTATDMDERVDTLTPMLIRSVAPEAIATTIDEFKKSMTQQEFETSRNKIQTQLDYCIRDVFSSNTRDSNFNATQASNICIAVTAKDAFINIAPIIIEDSIAPLFKGDEQKVQELTKRAKRSVMACLEQVQDNENAQLNAEKCVTQELPNIAKNIASELLKDMNAFANADGRQRSLVRSTSYRDFERCLTRLDNPTLKDATANMNDCIKDLEKGVKGLLKDRFVEVYGQNAPTEMEEMINLVLQIPGKPVETEYSSTSKTDGMSNAQLISTLELLGETMEYSCNNNSSVCSRDIHSGKLELTRHFENNPNATTEENTKALMRSDIMSNIIASQIGMTLNTTLKSQLSEYNDRDNNLYRKIDEITNNRLIVEILQTPQGSELKDYILEKIDKGELDNLAQDRKLRELLANALTADTGENSFGDGLAAGLVQNELDKMRRRSRGLPGLFKEFKIMAGDFFNIIDRKDFKWDIITRTPSGRKAREYMIHNIIAPSIRGEDLTQLTSSRSQFSNLQAQRLDTFKELITKALKEANE